MVFQRSMCTDMWGRRVCISVVYCFHEVLVLVHVEVKLKILECILNFKEIVHVFFHKHLYLNVCMGYCITYLQEIFADVRLECDGHEHWVHKFILSACSEYFQEVLVDVPHRGSVTVSSYVQHKQLVSLLDFMYLGEVIVPQEELAELVNAAEVLMVRGFAVPCEEADDDDENNDEDYQERDIFSRVPEKLANQSDGYDSSYLEGGGGGGGSTYLYDHKLNHFKRRLPEDEDDNKAFIKERRMMGQQGMGDIAVKEEPLDPDYTDRFHYPGSQSNRFHQNMQMPGGGDMGQNNPNDGMNARQGVDVNGGNSSTDISNLLNVLIDSPSNVSMSETCIILCVILSTVFGV